jgi:hypothetical protein
MPMSVWLATADFTLFAPAFYPKLGFDPLVALTPISLRRTSSRR